jgi:hypothetical protein
LGGIGAIGLVTARGPTNAELVERGGADARLRAVDNLSNEQGVRQRRCRSSGGAQRTEAVGVRAAAGSDQLHHRAQRLCEELQKLRAENANASASSDLSVIRRFNLSSLVICHAPLLERINSRTAFAAFTNGGAAAIIITQNTTASQAEC